MPLKLIERYIFKKALLAVIIATLALVGVVWVIKAFQQVDVVLSKGQGILLYLYMTTLGVPTLTGSVLPIALLLALTSTINSLNADSELVVINASGASKWVIIRPFLMVALLISIIVFTLSLWVGPNAMQTLRGYVTQVRADLVSVVVQEGQFRELGDGLTFHVASRAPGGVLEGVFVLDERSDKETFTYLAKRGTLEKIGSNAFLILQEGQIQRVSAGEQNMSVIRFNSYAFNLATLSGAQDVTVSSPEELPTTWLFKPPIDNAYVKTKPGALRGEFHSRFTSGLYPLFFALFVLAYAGQARSNRQNFTTVLTFAAITCIVLRAFGLAATSAARNDPTAVYFAWAIPIAGFAIPIWFLVTNRQIAVPAFVQNMVDRAVKMVADTTRETASRLPRNRRREANP